MASHPSSTPLSASTNVPVQAAARRAPALRQERNAPRASITSSCPSAGRSCSGTMLASAGTMTQSGAGASTISPTGTCSPRPVRTSGRVPRRAVYDILSKGGFHVTIVQEPLSGLTEDIEATKRALDQQSGPVVLVGHSYAGPVITDAGADPRSKRLSMWLHSNRMQGKPADNCCRSSPPTMPCGRPTSIFSSTRLDSVRPWLRMSRRPMLNSQQLDEKALGAPVSNRLCGGMSIAN